MGTVRPGRLEGKVCIVTGAGSSRGIGYVTVNPYWMHAFPNPPSVLQLGNSYALRGRRYDDCPIHSALNFTEAQVHGTYTPWILILPILRRYSRPSRRPTRT